MASCKLQAWKARNGSTRKMYKDWRMASYSAHSPPNPNPSLLTSSQPNCNIKCHSESKIIAEEPPQKSFLVAEFLKHLSRPMISFQSPELSQEGWYCLSMDNISDRIYIYTVKKIYIYIYVIFIYQYILYTYWQNIIIGPSFLCGVRLSALSQVCHTDCKKIDELFHRPGHGKRWIKHFGKNWFYWGLVPKKSASPCSMRGYLLREITRDMRFFPSMGYPAGGSKREGPWLQLCAVWSKHSYWDCHSLLASPLKLTWLGR